MIAIDATGEPARVLGRQPKDRVAFQNTPQRGQNVERASCFGSLNIQPHRRNALWEEALRQNKKSKHAQ
jgi:hypothetical protein